MKKIIKVNNDGVFINHKQFIPFSKTNLPIDEFAFIGDYFWEVNVEKTSPASAKKHPDELHVEVIDYHAKSLEQFYSQELKKDIPFLLFRPFQFEQFSLQVSPIQPGVLRRLCADHPAGSKNLIYDHPVIPNGESYYSSQKIQERKNHLSRMQEESDIPKPDITTKVVSTFAKSEAFANEAAIGLAPTPLLPIPDRTFSFKVSWHDATIIDGGVTFKKILTGSIIPESFMVANHALRKEYDLLKEYIIKKLGKKTFEVSVIVQTSQQRKITTISASAQIDQINAAFFEQIRIEQIRRLTKKTAERNIKLLQTIDELTEGKDALLGKTFSFNIDDIIGVLTEEANYRNKEEVKSLALLHDINMAPVRISLNPNFGFVFMLPSASGYCYVWELLQSHATYIWIFKNETDQQESFSMVETAFSEIYEHGRNRYKTAQKGFKKNNPLRFEVIEHKLDGNEELNHKNWMEQLMFALNS